MCRIAAGGRPVFPRRDALSRPIRRARRIFRQFRAPEAKRIKARPAGRREARRVRMHPGRTATPCNAIRPAALSSFEKGGLNMPTVQTTPELRTPVPVPMPEKKVEDEMPAAGPHAKPHLTDMMKTPGCGALPDPERPPEMDSTG